MRSISVDTKGFIFSTKVLLTLCVLGALWFSWTPVQQFLSFKKESSNNSAVQTVYSNEENKEIANAVDTQVYSGRYIFVDVVKMSVEIHTPLDDGISFTILSLPDASSSDAVVEGPYTIDEKVKTKLSTITMTRFPYYSTFGDRYAFHGTPTDAQGKPLTEKYVGGMIELTTEDAKQLYAFVEMGMPVIVQTKEPPVEEKIIPVPSVISLPVSGEEFPATSAKAYAIVDVSNGQVFLDKNEDSVYPIASVTKLVTALVATDVIGHGSEVQAPNGEYYTLSDLYYPLLLQSDNEVAKKIATHAGATFFMSNMNAYVETLGMKHTSFSDSSGLSPKNISCVTDLVKFAQYLYTEKSYILDITREEKMAITSTKGAVWNVRNQNKLASDPHFRGGKLGYTDEAGQTSVAIFSVPLHGEARPIAVVILHSKDWKQDTRTLLSWLVQNTK